MLIEYILNEEEIHELTIKKTIEAFYGFEQDGNFYRCKVKIYKQIKGWDLIFKILYDEVPDLEDLNLPAKLSEAIKIYKKGLIIINGIKDSGKTTTIASLIEYVNKDRYIHTIMLADVIEYRYKPQKSLIRQRILNRDFISLHETVSAASKEDVDVLYVYDFDDYNVIKESLIAAEKGILVLACMNTIDTRRALYSLVDKAPDIEKPYIRHLLAENLKVILSQKLLLKADGGGLVPATEFVIAHPDLYKLIEEGTFDSIDSLILETEQYGMHNFAASISGLLKTGIITEAEALKAGMKSMENR